MQKPTFNPSSHAYYSYITNDLFLFLGMKQNISLNEFLDVVDDLRDIIVKDEAPHDHKIYALDYLHFVSVTVPKKLELQ